MPGLVHEIAQAGFQKGTNELYDRARPSYPAAALSAIRSSLCSKKSSFNILEVAAGTGIFTRALLNHPEWPMVVHELCAVEPSEGMRDQFSRVIHDPRVCVQKGSFEQTHVPDGWADLLVIAQAFHWCLDHNNAMAEFARALSPTGCLVFLWNLEDDATGWACELHRYVKTLEPKLLPWRRAFLTPSYLRHFQTPEESVFRHVTPTTVQGIIDRTLSRSYIVIQDDSGKAQIAKDVMNILDRGEGQEWTDEKKRIISYPYITRVIIMKRK